MKSPSTFDGSQQRGFTLIEVLVSIALSLSLLAAMGLVYQNLNSGQRIARAQQQMNQDAQAAFQLLAGTLRDAGFNPIQPRTTTPPQNSLTALATGIPAGRGAMGVFGCEFGFSNAVGAGAGIANDISALTCNNVVTPKPTIPPLYSSGLAVQYEADPFTAEVVPVGSPPVLVPADCRGFAIAAPLSQPLTTITGAAAGSVNYYVVENRYFIGNGGLSCTGNGGGVGVSFTNPPQPLVMNIETFQVDYGVKAPNALPPNDRFPSGYLNATEIGPAFGAVTTGVHASFTSATPPITPDGRWAQVSSLRLCLVVASSDVVYTEDIAQTAAGQPIQAYYFGCRPEDNAPIPITDRRARKAYVMHLALRNRINEPNL